LFVSDIYCIQRYSLALRWHCSIEVKIR